MCRISLEYGLFYDAVEHEVQLFLLCLVGFMVSSYVTIGIRHVHGLVQDCSNSIDNALELLQSCAKPSM